MNTDVSASTGRTGVATLLPCVTGSYQECFEVHTGCRGKKKRNISEVKAVYPHRYTKEHTLKGISYCSEGEKAAGQLPLLH